MTITRTQKKKAMQMFIREHFSDKLTEAGFVSYKGEDFHWYKYRDGLIYTIKMPIMRANLPLTLDVRFGVIPVFVWEHIAPECFSDKMGEVFNDGRDHLVRSWSNLCYNETELLLGKFPRPSYYVPRIAHHMTLEDGREVFIEHLNTPGCGSEVLEEMIFPFFDRMDSVAAVYAWNKRWKEAFVRDADSVKSQEDVRQLRSSLGKYEYWASSSAFVDECLYLRDEEWYPIILHAMKREEENRQAWEETMKKRHFEPYRTNEEKLERANAIQHRKIMIQALEAHDFTRIDEELGSTRQRMLEQIKRKLPQLQMN